MQTELVVTLRDQPGDIIDRDFLKKVVDTLEIKERDEGEPYVFEYIQQPIGGHLRLIPQQRARTVGMSFAKGCYVLGVYGKKEFKDRLNELEQEAERILAEDWGKVSNELGIEAKLQDGQPCPFQGELEERRYCKESDLSKGRCHYNTGKTFLVPHKEGGPGIDSANFRTKAAKTLAGEFSQSDVQNLCLYVPRRKEEG